MLKPFQQVVSQLRAWRPPRECLRIEALDMHTAGEPLRIVLDGWPDLVGATMLERRRYARERLDDLRAALMLEPRGHADMYGALITPPVSPEADFGVLFMHNEGYSTMCGHGVLALVRAAVETGMVDVTEPETTIRIDTPAGLVTGHATVEDGRYIGGRFLNVPSFVLELDAHVQVPGLGTVRYDLAFGGAFYAHVQAADVAVELVPGSVRELIDLGTRIKRAVMESREIQHPTEPDLGFLYGVIFIGPPHGDGAHSRNVCIFAEGEVDRSPTGTGVSSRLAIHHARGEIEVGEPIVIESILGTRFTGRVDRVTAFEGTDAVIPEVSGEAHVTGRNVFYIDPDDLLRDGFMLR